MTRDETAKLMAIIKAVYPNYHSRSDAKSMNLALDAHFNILQDVNEKVATNAVFEYMAKANQFPPTAGDILQMSDNIQSEIDKPMFDFFGRLCVSFTAPKVERFVIGEVKRRRLNPSKLNGLNPQDFNNSIIG